MRIRLITRVPALIQWLNSHPYKDDEEAHVWVKVKANGGNELITYAEACKILRELTLKAGINKPANPHHFRTLGLLSLPSIWLKLNYANTWDGFKGAMRLALAFIYLKGI